MSKKAVDTLRRLLYYSCSISMGETLFPVNYLCLMKGNAVSCLCLVTLVQGCLQVKLHIQSALCPHCLAQCLLCDECSNIFFWTEFDYQGIAIFQVQQKWHITPNQN